MKRYARGSYTVEAAIIMPFLLLIMVATIHIAINFHEEIKQVAKESEEVQEIPIIKIFYHTEMIGEILQGAEDFY